MGGRRGGGGRWWGGGGGEVRVEETSRHVSELKSTERSRNKNPAMVMCVTGADGFGRKGGGGWEGGGGRGWKREGWGSQAGRERRVFRVKSRKN